MPIELAILLAFVAWAIGTAKQAELDAIAAAVPGIQASASALTTAVAEVTAALG